MCPQHEVPTLDLEAPATARLENGVVLAGRFRLDGFLNQGGMGAVLAATDLRNDRGVVVKVLKGDRVHERAYVRRFYQEARVARSLRHPNIVRILEFGVDEATRAPYLAMERIEGATLKELLLEGGPLPESRAAAIFAQVAEALAFAHRQNVLHRDLKPSNVMIARGVRQEVEVLDFGLAKLLDGDEIAPLTQPGKTVGTPSYMSPEQVTQRPQDFRTDLYGLGCMLHAALTGTPPFFDEDPVTVMRRQMQEPAPPLPPLLVDGRPPSPALVALHRELLQKEPRHRPRSTEEVARRLEAIASGDPQVAPEPRVQSVTKEIDTQPGALGLDDSSSARTLRGLGAEEGETELTPAYRGLDPTDPRAGVLPAVITLSGSGTADELDTPMDLSAPGRETNDLPTRVLPSDAAATNLVEVQAALPSSGTRPASPRTRKRPRYLLALSVSISVLGVSALAAPHLERWLFQRRAPAPSLTPDRSPSAVPLPPRRLVLITSEPPGAVVTARERALGTTPLSLELAGTPREVLEIRLEGHRPAFVDLAATPGDAVHLRLEAEAGR